MKCPECGYISFDHLETCQKCGAHLHKNQDPSPRFSSEHNGTSGESSPPYHKLNPEANEKPPERIMEEGFDESSDTLQDSNESEGRSPANHFQAHGPEADDAAHPANSFLSSESKEEIKTDIINTDINKPKGGFWIRSLAFIIDLIFINILISIFAWTIKLGVISGARIILTKPDTLLDLREFLVSTTGIAIIAFYFIYFHAKTGQTPGKSLLHLKVIRTDGSPLGLEKSIGRFFCYIISLLPLYVGFLLIAFNKKKQGLHDIITRTYVIKTG